MVSLPKKRQNLPKFQCCWVSFSKVARVLRKVPWKMDYFPQWSTRFMVLYQWNDFGNGEIRKNYLYMYLSSHVGVPCRFMMDFPISLLVYSQWHVMHHRDPAPCVILKYIQYTPINIFLVLVLLIWGSHLGGTIIYILLYYVAIQAIYHHLMIKKN